MLLSMGAITIGNHSGIRTKKQLDHSPRRRLRGQATEPSEDMIVRQLRRDPHLVHRTTMRPLHALPTMEVLDTGMWNSPYYHQFEILG